MTAHTPGAILVGVDNSPNSNIAAAWAVAIARATSSPIRAVTAWTRRTRSDRNDVDDPTADTDADAVLTGKESLRSAGLEGIEVTAVRGPAAEALLKTADSLDASLLVVGTRGLGPLAGLLLGSVSRRLLFTTDRPLALIPRQSTLNPAPLTRILVGVDCSPVAQRALSWSAEFCADLGVSATIIRCADPGCERPPGHVERYDEQIRDDTEEALVEFRDHGIEYTLEVCNRDPRISLPKAAARDGAGLIVIGTRGAGNFSGLGGTASYLVRHSSLPLVAIP
jgi:nucleotide-binding universal stress UspA family protein